MLYVHASASKSSVPLLHMQNVMKVLDTAELLGASNLHCLLLLHHAMKHQVGYCNQCWHVSMSL
jgi:hypothetical protein